MTISISLGAYRLMEIDKQGKTPDSGDQSDLVVKIDLLFFD